MQILFYLLLLLLFPLGSQAAGWEINMSNKSADIGYVMDMSVFGYEGSDIGFGVFYNEEGDYSGHAQAMVYGQSVSNNRLQVGAGVKGYYGHLDAVDSNFGGIAISGGMRYLLATSLPSALVLNAHYAPAITSIDPTESILEGFLGSELEIVESARILIGYHYFLLHLDEEEMQKAETNDEQKQLLNNRFHVGVRISF